MDYPGLAQTGSSFPRNLGEKKLVMPSRLPWFRFKAICLRTALPSRYFRRRLRKFLFRHMKRMSINPGFCLTGNAFFLIGRERVVWLYF